MIRILVVFICLALSSCAITTAKLQNSHVRTGYRGEAHDIVVFLIPDKMPPAFAERLLSRIEYLIEQHHVQVQTLKVMDAEKQIDLPEQSLNHDFSLRISAAYTQKLKLMPGVEQLRSITLAFDLFDIQKNETEFTAIIDTMKGVGFSIGEDEADSTAALLISKLEEAHFLHPTKTADDQSGK